MKNNNPILRFHEFNENWVLKSIEELAKEFFGGGTPKTTISEFWNGEIPWLQSSDLTNHKVYGVTSKKNINSSAIKNSATKIIPKDSIAIVTRVGVGKIALLEHPYSTSQDFLSLSGLNIDKWFGVYLLYNKLQKELKQVQGTSIKGITKSELLRKNVSIPEINEQSKLGDFFKKLDDTISLHQQELEALKQTKQGFLQKMFPKDGENIPEVRFLEFTNKWNEENLKSVFKDFIVPMRDKPREFSGDIPWTRIEDIEGRYLNGTKSGQFVSENTVKSMNLKVIPKGALIVSVSATFGIVAIVNTDLITNQTFIGLVPNEEFDLNFLYSLFQSTGVRKKLKKESAGSTIFYISRKQFEGLVSYFPEREEQVKIGEFFRQLDEVIELKEKELKALKETKKGFLQKMFV